MALSTTVALRRNWSYSITSLRHSTGQIEKITKSLVGVFLLIAGGCISPASISIRRRQCFSGSLWQPCC